MKLVKSRSEVVENLIFHSKNSICHLVNLYVVCYVVSNTYRSHSETFLRRKTANGFQHCANLLNNGGEVVGKCQILLIHKHLLPFEVIAFPLFYAIARMSNERF